MGQIEQVRRVLRTNAVVTAGCGALVLAAGGPLADLAEVERVVVTAVGAFFVVLGIDVGFLAGRAPGAVVQTARVLAVADAGWTLATVAVVAAGMLPLPAALPAMAVGAVTAGFAVAEHRAAGAARPAVAMAT